MWKIALSLVAALTVATPALAASELFAERAKVLASGDKIQIFGLPAIDSQGTVKYFDTTITLRHGDNGRPKKQASVITVASPNIDPMGFVPGVYEDQNLLCELRKAPFGGQTEVIVDCVDKTYPSRTAGLIVYTGPITGNPSAQTLISRGADQVPGTEQYAWGLTTYRTGSYSVGGCLLENFITTARQIDDLLVLIRWSGSSVAQVCSLSLTRVDP